MLKSSFGSYVMLKGLFGSYVMLTSLFGSCVMLGGLFGRILKGLFGNCVMVKSLLGSCGTWKGWTLSWLSTMLQMLDCGAAKSCDLVWQRVVGAAEVCAAAVNAAPSGRAGVSGGFVVAGSPPALL